MSSARLADEAKGDRERDSEGESPIEPGAHSARLLAAHTPSSSRKSPATATAAAEGTLHAFSSSSKSLPHTVEKSESALYQWAMRATWTVNLFLVGAKLYVTIVSSSKAVLASLIDSCVDILTQTILVLAERYMARRSPLYPVGRSRLEALSVIACAFIMTASSLDVIQFSAIELYGGLSGKVTRIELNYTLYTVLGVGIFCKLFLWLFCQHVNKSLDSDALRALAEDHFNDVFSNSAAIATAAIAFNTIAWWVDPLGAILISIVIIYRWFGIIYEQVKKIVGHTAPPEFIEQVEKLATDHDSRLEVDCTRVYHFGSRFNVELEIVLPGEMTVAESHDLALALQHKIERLEDVERAFVHVDHKRRDVLEHKIERELWSTSKERKPSRPMDERVRVARDTIPDV